MRYPKGYGIVFKKVLCDPTLKIEVKALYALLAAYTGQDDVCWPSVPTMAKALGCSEQSIRNWCRELEKRGWLQVQKSDRSSNTYELQIPYPPQPGLTPPSTGVEGTPSTGVDPTMNTLTSTNDKEIPESTPVVPDDASHPPVQPRKAVYDYEKKVWKLTESDIEFWEECYEGVDVKKELFHMKAWLSAHPKKKDFNRFITSWLSRSQERSTTFARRAK